MYRAVNLPLDTDTHSGSQIPAYAFLKWVQLRMMSNCAWKLIQHSPNAFRRLFQALSFGGAAHPAPCYNLVVLGKPAAVANHGSCLMRCGLWRAGWLRGGY